MTTRPSIDKLAAVLSLLLLCSCSDADSSHTILDNAGFTDIKLTGHRWFACAKDDNINTGFEAKGGTGKLVTGVVCFGITTGTSIRIDSPHKPDL